MEDVEADMDLNTVASFELTTRWPGREGLVPQLAAAVYAPKGSTETFLPLPTVIGEANPAQLPPNTTMTETFPPLPTVVGDSNLPQLPPNVSIMDIPDHGLTKIQLQRRKRTRRAWGQKINELGLHYDEDEMYADLSENQKKSYAEYVDWQETVRVHAGSRFKYHLMFKAEAQEKLDKRQREFEDWVTKEWAEEAARLADIRECFDTCMEAFIAIAKDETQPEAKRKAAKMKMEDLALVWDKGNFAMPAWGPAEKVHQEVGVLENNAGKQKHPIQVDSDTDMDG